MDVTVRELWIYPVKSCQGIALKQSVLTPEGLEYDRRWAILDGDGRCLTQRKLPQMALIATALDRYGHLTLSAPNKSTISVKITQCTKRLSAHVWSYTVDALLAPENCNTWISDALGVNATLVYFDPCYRRAIDPKRFGQSATGFADAAPFLVANQASLSHLQEQLPAIENFSLSMLNFRPNLVIEGIDAFDEYQYKTLIGNKWQLNLIDPSIRCSMIGVEPTKGTQLGGSAVLKGVARLSSAKDNPKAPIFGLNSTLVGESFANIRLGESARLV